MNITTRHLLREGHNPEEKTMRTYIRRANGDCWSGEEWINVNVAVGARDACDFETYAAAAGYLDAALAADESGKFADARVVTVDTDWQVFPGGAVRWSLATLYADARQRVLSSRRLRPYLEIILSDGYADDEDHLRWVVEGKVSEIETWAEQIEGDTDNG
jgi:hypothetical protein